MSYHTYTDRQGEDDQETTATSIVLDMNLLSGLVMRVGLVHP